uniref:Uncharacterized protein n=1 Tax=Onchocerca volvulus TaxID=6282 RepID=A0A8R1TYB6_ONCVO
MITATALRQYENNTLKMCYTGMSLNRFCGVARICINIAITVSTNVNDFSKMQVPHVVQLCQTDLSDNIWLPTIYQLIFYMPIE